LLLLHLLHLPLLIKVFVVNGSGVVSIITMFVADY